MPGSGPFGSPGARFTCDESGRVHRLALLGRKHLGAGSLQKLSGLSLNPGRSSNTVLLQTLSPPRKRSLLFLSLKLPVQLVAPLKGGLRAVKAEVRRLRQEVSEVPQRHPNVASERVVVRLGTQLTQLVVKLANHPQGLRLVTMD